MGKGLLADRPVGAKIMTAVGGAGAAIALVATVGVIDMYRLHVTAEQLYATSMIPLPHLADLHNSELKSRLDVTRIATQQTAKDRPRRAGTG